MAESLLEAKGIETGYGKVQVLWGATLYVAERESVVLLGATGAG
jgi:branched-chain amino acid transport system ATP-binding protein